MKTYQREELNDQTIADLKPLLQSHWEEIARNKHINVLDPDFDGYLRIQAEDLFRMYTIRLDGELLGYTVYFLSYNIHYPSSLQAVNDVLFVTKQCRGLPSIRLLQYAERELKADGVDLIHMHMKVISDHPKLFKVLGYEHAENVYEKLLTEE